MKKKTFLDLASAAPGWRVRRAIGKGADFSVRDENGYSALMLAAATNPHPGAIKVLLKAGLDVNGRHVDGLTPLLAATFFGNRAGVIAALVQAGAVCRREANRG